MVYLHVDIFIVVNELGTSVDKAITFAFSKCDGGRLEQGDG